MTRFTFERGPRIELGDHHMNNYFIVSCFCADACVMRTWMLRSHCVLGIQIIEDQNQRLSRSNVP